MVDALARQRLGGTADSLERACAALTHVLQRGAGSGGHCYLERSQLLGAAARLLADHRELPTVGAREIADEAIGALARGGDVLIEPVPRKSAGNGEAALKSAGNGEAVFLLPVVREEINVAASVRKRLPPPGIAAADASSGGELSAVGGIPLSPRQRDAVALCALASDEGCGDATGRLLVLTGAPGTGKTHTVNAVVREWRARRLKVLLACPTARAAAVLGEAVGMAACTIHRLLEYNPKENAFKRNRLNPLDVNAIVVDEVRHVSHPATCHIPPRVTPRHVSHPATCHRRRCSTSRSRRACSTPSPPAASSSSSAMPTSSHRSAQARSSAIYLNRRECHVSSSTRYSGKIRRVT